MGRRHHRIEIQLRNGQIRLRPAPILPPSYPRKLHPRLKLASNLATHILQLRHLHPRLYLPPPAPNLRCRSPLALRPLGYLSLDPISVLPSFIVVFVQCRPYARSWNPTLPGECMPITVNSKMALYSGTLAVIQDWLLATLPIAFLWKMQIGLQSTIGICALRSMGLL